MKIKEGEAHPIGRGIQGGIHKLGIAMNRETVRPFILLTLSHAEGRGVEQSKIIVLLTAEMFYNFFIPIFPFYNGLTAPMLPV